jgi:hypothetical protein
MATQSNDDEYLKNYLSANEYKDDKDEEQPKSNNNNNGFKSAKELEFINIDVSELPCAPFYPAGTTVFVRAARVNEIQAFSVVDDTNFYDMYEKVNQLVENCVFLKTPEQKRVPYTYLMDGDRWYMLFIIRELTFQEGTDLYTEVKGTKIPIKRGYFEYHEMNEKLKKYYDRVQGLFEFPTKSGSVKMAPPTIGVQKSFTDYMINKVSNKKELDQSFLKIIPYTLPGRLSITEEGIEKKLQEFKQMDLKLFQFLNKAVDMMSFGISGVKTITEGGMEVRSQDIFPEGISGLFLQSDAFDEFIKA